MQKIMSSLGPGLLYAGAAVGVSHLVQSSRAGAEFGLQLLGIILIANVLKYPFFQIGPRYSALTGRSLLHGYKELSPVALPLAILLTLGSMFTVIAAVSIVTAGLALKLFAVGIDAKLMAALVMSVCAGLLIVGRFGLLESIMKWVVVALSLTTIVAVVSCWGNSPGEVYLEFQLSDPSHFLFLVALVGWMPGPIDISIWHSLWTIEKNKLQKQDVKAAIFDFNVGYAATIFLAVCFTLLGYFVFYGSGTKIEAQAGLFAGQLITMYTHILGDWFFPVIALAAFTTMFSTTITCMDAYPRVLGTSLELMVGAKNDAKTSRWIYVSVLATLVIGSSIVLFFFIENMKAMIQLATGLAFVIAPIFAYLNLRAMQVADVPEEWKLSPAFVGFSWLGIIGFSVFSVVYLCVGIL